MDTFIYFIIAVVAIETALLIYVAVTSYNKAKTYCEQIKALYKKLDRLAEDRCLRCVHSDVDVTGIWCNKYKVVGPEIESCRPQSGRKD